MTYECSICTEPLDIQTNQPAAIPCGHTFHRGCVERWISMANKCPICIAAVSDDQIMTLFFSNSNDDDGQQGVVLQTIREDFQESLTRLDSVLSGMDQKSVENHRLRNTEYINIMKLMEELSTVRRELAEASNFSEIQREQLDVITRLYQTVLQKLKDQEVETRVVQSRFEALSKETERISVEYWNTWAELESMKTEFKETKKAEFDKMD